MILSLGLCSIIIGCVMVACGAIRAQVEENDAALPEIEQIWIDDV